MDRIKLSPLEPSDLDPRPVYLDTDNASQTYGRELRSGDHCPICLKGLLDYDGTLNLYCSECGFTLSGCFT